jgi:hypothetical protein
LELSGSLKRRKKINNLIMRQVLILRFQFLGIKSCDFLHRQSFTIVFAVLAFTALIYAQEAPVTPESDTGTQIKEGAKKALDATVDGAKVVGTKIADGAAAGYGATKDYLNNKTVSDIGDDVAKGAKAVGTGIVEGSKSAWQKVTGWFS